MRRALEYDAVGHNFAGEIPGKSSGGAAVGRVHLLRKIISNGTLRFDDIARALMLRVN
jgi:hypothetical protein